MDKLTAKIDKLIFDKWGHFLTGKEMDKAWSLLQEASKYIKTMDEISGGLRESQKKLMEKIDTMQWLEFPANKPKEDKDYLCTNKYGYCHVWEYRKIDEKFYDAKEGSQVVTHFQPTPPLPVKKDNPDAKEKSKCQEK